LSDSEQRIGITLIRLAEEQGTIKRGNVIVHNLPFQQDIANMAGTSRETVSRTLKLLEDKKLVKRDGSDITIYNFSAFKESFS
jgi:CRP-like cAMP-binding protein